LGGNAPFIVFDDADIEAASRERSVQIPQRRPDLRVRQPILVQDGVYDAFTSASPRRRCDEVADRSSRVR